MEEKWFIVRGELVWVGKFLINDYEVDEDECFVFFVWVIGNRGRGYGNRNVEGSGGNEYGYRDVIGDGGNGYGIRNEGGRGGGGCYGYGNYYNRGRRGGGRFFNCRGGYEYVVSNNFY